MSKCVKSLTKREILALPGFNQHSRKSLRELKQLLTTKLNELGINRRGVKVQDYTTAYQQHEKEVDDTLFNNHPSGDGE